MTEEDKKRIVRITNIQRFCLNDGPGIRTTVFFKGCSIHCPWCSNPENILYKIQPYFSDDESDGIYGYDILLQDLADELKKDEAFYIKGGGITLSGGEPLLQIEKYEPLLEQLKADGINIAIETSLFSDTESVKTALNYIDWWYIDMKSLIPQICKNILGGDMELYLNNLSLVSKSTESLCLRIPCAHTVADISENLEFVTKTIKQFGIKNIEIFKIHNLSEKKYKSLKLQLPESKYISDDAVNTVAEALEKSNIPFKIIKI